MAFEGFEGAVLIETSGFSPNILAQPDAFADAAGTLEAALRQIGLGPEAAARADILLDRAALRAEAGVLDLWVHGRGGSNVQALDRPGSGLGADASWRALAPQADDDAQPSEPHAHSGKAIPLSANLDKPAPKPEPKEEENEVVVKGTRPKTYDEGGLDGIPTGDGSDGNQIGGGGTTGSGSSSQKVADHTQDCGSSDDGAAVQVAKHVMGVPPGAGPPNPVLAGGFDWKAVEFGAVIVRNPDGTYGALYDAIYSNAAPGYVHTPDFEGTNAVGIWHNHPLRGDADQQAINSYPSADQRVQSDWDALQELKDAVAPNDPNFDPSLWITGPDGVTREFKLSEREYYENLTPEQMAAREGLDGKERTQSCGS